MTSDSQAPPSLAPLSATVAYDVGTSGSKVIASYQVGEYPFHIHEEFFLIAPAMRQLTQQTYESMLSELEFGGEGVGTALLAYTDPAKEERVYLEVGATATRPGMLSISERKFDRCVAKVLSFLGYLVQHKIETDDPIELNLGILLPFDEIADRKLLAEWLRQSISRFEFNGRPIENISLKQIDIKPEGYGIRLAYGAERVLIVGHSDTSWLCFSDGILNTKLSRTLPETGMHDFLKTLSFPIDYELKAARAIAMAGSTLKSKYLVELTQTRSEMEVSQLRKAIELAKPQYWVERQMELRSLHVGGAKLVVVSGGTAAYFSTELNSLFRELFGVKLNWSRELIQEFKERFEEPQEVLCQRLADCYGYFRFLPGVTRYAIKKDVEVMGDKSHD